MSRDRFPGISRYRKGVESVSRENHFLHSPCWLVNCLSITGCSCCLEVRGWAIEVTLIWFSAISFILFGCGCFVSPAMRREFERYGLPGFRKLVGILQLLGSIGLLVGLHIPWVGQFASGGLALLMLGGVGVRIKIKDTALLILPAFAYLVLNAYLAIAVY